MSDQEIEIRVVAEGLQFPEGPIWLSDGSVLLVEIAAQTLTRITPNGTKQVVAQLSGGPNGAALGPDGHIYICNNGGFTWSQSHGYLTPSGPSDDYRGGWIERVCLETGRAERLFDKVNDTPLTGPNDIVFDRFSGFWFTDHGKKYPRHMDLGGVYYCGGDTPKQAVFPMLGPNGIGLSPSETALYVAETSTGRLWEYALSAAGQIESLQVETPTGGRLVCGLPGWHRYDSLAIEADGNIAVANLRNGAIVVVNTAGELVQHLALDDPYTTNICFGGPDMKTAFITLSGSGKLISVRWPRAGHRLNFAI